MTIDHRPRRTQPVPGWVDGAWAWLGHATEGITWLVGLCAVLSLIGFGYFPFDLHDRSEARALQAQGEWVTTGDVQVHIHWVGGRGGGYHEVDRVRVRLDGNPAQIELENVDAAQDNPLYDGIHEGWQQPTPITRYQAPLDVRVRRDGDSTILTAMAKVDYDYWTEDNTDPEFGLTLGFGGLGVTGVFLALNSLRLKRRTRRGGVLTRRQARYENTRRARVAVTGRRGRP
ncbi:hypothetical protein [Pedococcus bigeumensis]|uniref:Uncharacterized protein n=1 Tax=Pedococcus bigeumensis TaxID=433644 RepID=A0A502CWX3_9MICO|nr:hypothetical protein [Pedococcus bigeumensis]TPG17040.1 hypothetical protein EAH86_09700 [Pedococcus bigeumensis]